MKLFAISGSLRAGSSATALAEALATFAPAGTVVTVYAELEQIPLELFHVRSVSDPLLESPPHRRVAVQKPNRTRVDLGERLAADDD